MIFPGPHAPSTVDRYLLPHEQEVITVRRHPAVLIPRLAAAMGGLLATVAMSFVPSAKTSQLIAWIFTAFLFLELALATIRWLNSYVVVTSHRILLTSGLSGRRVDSTPLADIPDLGLRQSLQGRLFGYGRFFARNGRLVIDYIPYVEQLYLEVSSKLHPSRHSELCLARSRWGCSISRTMARGMPGVRGTPLGGRRIRCPRGRAGPRSRIRVLAGGPIVWRRVLPGA
jgi:PH (Pleckstrin Homology) domain-containing protein